MLEDITSSIAAGDYLVAVGGFLLAFVGTVQKLLAAKIDWFATRVGKYTLAYASAALLYAGAALHSGSPLTGKLVLAAFAAALASSGGLELLRDLLSAAKSTGSGTGSTKVALVVTLLCLVTVSCGGKWTETKPGQAVVDCFTADRNQLDALTGELSPLVFGESPDWSAVYDRAKHAGKVIGGCVLAELVQKYLGGKKAPETGPSWEARGALEQFRKEEAGGATFHTALGDL